MKTIQTAEEFLLNKKDACYSHGDLKDKLFTDDVINYMIEFAKLHVEKALKEASENAYAVSSNSNITSKDRLKGVQGLICVHLGNVFVNKDSILNAYTLDNIK